MYQIYHFNLQILLICRCMVCVCVCVCVMVSSLSFTFTCWVLHKSCWAPNVPYLPCFDPEPARDRVGDSGKQLKLCRACASYVWQKHKPTQHLLSAQPGLIPLLSETDMLCLPGFLSLSLSLVLWSVSLLRVLIGLEPRVNGPLASLRFKHQSLAGPAVQHNTAQHTVLNIQHGWKNATLPKYTTPHRIFGSPWYNHLRFYYFIYSTSDSKII